jgi:hypothetical protein
MFKSSYVIAAGLIAAAIVSLPGLSPVQAYAPNPAVKADRLDARPASDCSQREWPYYETSCLRDAKYPDGKARAVRVISIDRLPSLPATAAAQ